MQVGDITQVRLASPYWLRKFGVVASFGRLPAWIAIPDAILLKPARLDAAETRLMQTHTTIAANLLAEGIARHHHEFWDGSGYPHGPT